MRVKPRVPFQRRFPKAAPPALALLEKMLAFDPDDRPTAEEALADPYFAGLADAAREPAAEIVSRSEYAFESRKVTPEEVRGLLYREILEYHPQAKREFEGSESPGAFGYATRGRRGLRRRRGGGGGRRQPGSTRRGASCGGARRVCPRSAWRSTARRRST